MTETIKIKWNHIKDKLPEENQEILTILKYQHSDNRIEIFPHIVHMRFIKNKIISYYDLDNISYYNIEYWTPLPNFPEEYER